jgi:SAM-dependent methyltransferase
MEHVMETNSLADQADVVREHLRGLWNTVAPGWREHADFIDKRAAKVTARMLELTAPQAGERVLELACGPGGTAIAAAPLVAPGGEVVASDIASEMTAIAAARAAERGLANVQAHVLDLEAIDQPDASFDVALCRDGIMLVPDPARAAGEIHRVLRTGGRAAIVVWGPRERNPWLTSFFRAAGEQLGIELPPPGMPGPFSLEDRDGFGEILAGAGFEGVVIEEHDVPLRARSAKEWSTRVVALAGPLAAILAGLPQEARDALHERLREEARPYETPRGLEFPGLALIASARR